MDRLYIGSILALYRLYIGIADEVLCAAMDVPTTIPAVRASALTSAHTSVYAHRPLPVVFVVRGGDRRGRRVGAALAQRALHHAQVQKKVHE